MTRPTRSDLVLAALLLCAAVALGGCRAHSTSARAPAAPVTAGLASGARAASGHTLGPPDAPVVIEAYQEFQCPYCRRAAATLAEVIDGYPGQVHLVFRHFPLEFHQQSRPAAKGAVAAEQQGRFWDYHDLMMAAAEDGLDKQDILDTAATLRLDPARFKAAMNGDAADAVIDADIAAGKALGVTGVPAFYINGRELRGAQGAEKFTAIIDEELDKAAALRAEGIPGYLLSQVLTQQNRDEAAK